MAFLLQLQCCIDIIVNDIMVGFATVAFLHTDAPFRIWRHISSFAFGPRVTVLLLVLSLQMALVRATTEVNSQEVTFQWSVKNFNLLWAKMRVSARIQIVGLQCIGSRRPHQLAGVPSWLL